MSKRIPPYSPLLTLVAFCFVTQVHAEDGVADGKITLGGGKVTMVAPKKWESKEPKFKGIVTAEFSIKPAEGDDSAARVTIGGAGGGIAANLARWESQYSQAKIDKSETKVAGQAVHWIDVQGTYKGSRFRKEASGPGFRLLGAIIATEKAGTYYVKFYGKAKTVAENEKAFKAMVERLAVGK